MTEITKANLLELIANIVWIAENRILPRLEPNEDLAPCLFVADSVQDIIGIVQLEIPADYEARLHMDALIRRRLNEAQASAYAVTMMGWMRELKPGEDRNSVRPSDHPDRIETFIITAGSKIAFTSKMYRVIRDKDQKISRLEDRLIEGSQEYGLFVDMLGIRPKTSTLH